MNIKKMTDEVVFQSLKEAGIHVVQVSDEQARNILKRNASNKQVQFRLEPAIFHSNASIALDSISQNKATAAQWLAMLTKKGGIKAAEDKWTGLSDWLHIQGNEPLTRKQLENYLAVNTLQVKEEQYMDAYNFDDLLEKLQQEFDNYMVEAEEEVCSVYSKDYWEYAFERMCEQYGEDFELGFGENNGILYVSDSECAGKILGINPINETRLKYTTPNIQDKKEIALYVPDIEPWNREDEVHFGEVGDGRCIAWIRFGTGIVTERYSDEKFRELLENMPKAEGWLKNETGGVYNAITWYPPVKSEKYPEAHIWQHNGRFIIMGVKDILSNSHKSLDDAIKAYNRHSCPKEKETKVLVIDEIQSKRHQEGRKDGYYTLAEQRNYQQKNVELEKRYEEEIAAIEKAHGGRLIADFIIEDCTPEEKQRLKIAEEEYFDNKKKSPNYSKKVMDAPFEKNWHELCMKRMLRYAAEEGYDKLLWTTGQQQVERNDMNEFIQEIDVTLKQDGERKIRLMTNYGDYWLETSHTGELKEPLETGNIKGYTLQQIIGKELAGRVLGMKENGSLKGDDFCIGGKGMKVFYDQILPQFMNRYGKQWGIRTDSHKLGLNGINMNFHGINVTPEMKKSVLQGQPMFMRDTKGKIYGWALDDTIYLTQKGMNAETAIHEYTHLWANAMRLADNKAWQKIKGLLRATPVWDEVLKDRNYRSLRKNDDALANEVLARTSGRANAEKLEQAIRQATSRNASIHGFQQIKQALGQFWSWVGRHILNIRKARTITDVTDSILGDLLRGNRPAQARDEHISDIQLKMFGQKPNLVPRIRCKINGEQQLFMDMSRKDFDNVQNEKNPLKRAEIQLQMAHKYFAETLKNNICQTENTGIKR